MGVDNVADVSGLHAASILNPEYWGSMYDRNVGITARIQPVLAPNS
jgi:hypothetical protein